jgi:hypothetical protein
MIKPIRYGPIRYVPIRFVTVLYDPVRYIPTSLCPCMFFIPEKHCHRKYVHYVPEFIDCANFWSLHGDITVSEAAKK